MTAAVLYRQASARVLIAAFRLRLALKLNPDWHLQPRVPAGHPHGGRWVPTSHLQMLLHLARLVPAAVRAFRVLARRIGSFLDSLPERWSGDLPREADFDPDLQRIAPPSPRRPDHELLRFRTEGELRRELGPAGPGREWHHIVEKRLAGKRFPAELIHSTDNIVSIPIELHRRVTGKMNEVAGYSNGMRVRHYIESWSFEEQHRFGIDLLEELMEDGSS